MKKYGTKRVQPNHMNYVLVKTWEAVTILYGKIIRERFNKTHLLLISPPKMITNTQTC